MIEGLEKRWGRWDLQAHSTFSDGQHAPSEVVRRAAAAGVEILALTDHDSVDGVGEAIAAGAEYGVMVVPAVELSSVDGPHEELHVLGYFIDHTDEQLLDALVDLRRDRQRRVLAMGDRLAELGFALDRRELIRRDELGLPLGRPHLAAAVVGHPDNGERLAAEGITTIGELFPGYLVPGAAAYVARSQPTVAGAIDLIRSSGGIAFWAHPFWDLTDRGEVRACLEAYTAAGLQGVEAFYPTHDAADTEWLVEQAQDLDLATSASSDFHGCDHAQFDGFLTYDTFGLPVDGGWLLERVSARR